MILRKIVSSLKRAEENVDIINKNAFQKDAYRPLVDRISQYALLRGGCQCLVLGWMPGPGGGCLPGTGGCLPGPGGGGVVSQHALGRTPPLPAVNRITDACENITLPQLRCGR